MSALSNILSTQGYLTIDNIIDQNDLETTIRHCEAEQAHKVGTRNMLDNDWVKSLGNKLRNNQNIDELLPKDAVLVKWNYFNKNIIDNWFVTPHRDLNI